MPKNVIPISQAKPRASGATLLTVHKIDQLKPRVKIYGVRDTKVVGLMVRVQPSGVKTFYVQGRIGSGRHARQVNVKVGRVGSISLSDARAKAGRIVADLAAGHDPARKTDEAAPLAEIIALYDARLLARQIVKRQAVIRNLKAGLAPFLNRPATALTRAHILEQMHAYEAKGLRGAADNLRKNTMTFLNFAVNDAHLQANPLAGYRREVQTRAEALGQPDRLTLRGPDALRAFWTATEAAKSAAFRDLLRFLLLTGQRRVETAQMKWADVHLEGYTSADGATYEGPTWVIPAASAKMARAQHVPLGSMSVELLKAQHRYAGTDLVFVGNTHSPITGWTSRLLPVRQALGLPDLAPQALRRSYRTGLSEIGVPEPLAETMIAHKRKDIVALYDFSELWGQRIDAQAKWESYIAEVTA